MVKRIITNQTAAGLRRSAVAERLRLREEWSTLKGTDDENELPPKFKKKHTQTLSKNMRNIKSVNNSQRQNITKHNTGSGGDICNPQSPNEALRGVVALVDVGTESRALALRAALTALGATVVPAWSHLVTHLVWTQGGCRKTRARARSLACKVVSPLWVEACAASARLISERVFPSTARDSDLPSPATLRRLLKRAEKENWPLTDLLSESEEGGKRIRLRISSDTDENRSNSGDTTCESVDVESRVNTAPRRALPVSISPPPANPKSKRRLFTVRAEAEDESDDENATDGVKKAKSRPQVVPKRPEKPTCVVKAPEREKRVKKYNLTQEQMRNLENAKRMARQLAKPISETRRECVQTQRRKRSNTLKIVLSGMPKSQHQAVVTAIHALKGKVQKHVNHRTTHVLLGTCREDGQRSNNARNNQSSREKDGELSTREPVNYCNNCNNPERLMTELFEGDNVTVTNHRSNAAAPHGKDVTMCCAANRDHDHDVVVVNSDEVVRNHNISVVCGGVINDKRLRTLKTLLGAARGCRVLHAQWALDSLKEKSWLPHVGYEVTHLLKIAQRARVERSAIDKMHSEYAYNVFRGMRVHVTETANQRDAAVQLLSLCGAEIVDETIVRENRRNIQTTNAQSIAETSGNGRRTQNGGLTQNGGATQTYTDINSNCDIVIIGKAVDDVTSKWVFDSVAAGRPRTIRRYVNKNICM